MNIVFEKIVDCNQYQLQNWILQFPDDIDFTTFTSIRLSPN